MILCDGKLFISDVETNEEKIDEIIYESNGVMCVKYNGEYIQYTSMYDNQQLFSVWCREDDVSNYRTIAIIFGLADGSYINSLREMNSEMLIIVYEPSVTLASQLNDGGIIEKMCDNKNTVIFVGKEYKNLLYKYIGLSIGYETLKFVRFFVSPNYERIYTEEIQYVIRIIEEQCKLVRFNRNTILISKDRINNNIFNNLYDCIEQKNLPDLIDAFNNIDKNDIPAIVVSAGPSLDKNIKMLKKAKGKAFIIAVDTALNALAKADILPDIAVTVDPTKSVLLFSHEKMIDIPLVYGLSANSEIMNVHKGTRIYHDAGDSVLNIFYDKFNKKRIALETGGSVANDAYSLAQKLGFKTIIFVGQDLAYPNDQEHSADSYGDTRNNYITNNGKVYFYVDDIYGGKVKTEYNMNMYRLWFERAVQVYSDIRHIDATEGGAKKEGMEIMSLEDAINETCVSKEDIDFVSIINSICNTFTDEERKEIYEYLSNYDSELKRIKAKLRKGVEYYEKMSECNNKQSYGKSFYNTFDKVKEINEWVANSEETKYLTMYVAEADYDVKSSVFDEKEDIYSDIKHMVNSGIKLLNAYLDAIDEVSDGMKDIINKAKTISEQGNDI